MMDAESAMTLQKRPARARGGKWRWCGWRAAFCLASLTATVAPADAQPALPDAASPGAGDPVQGQISRAGKLREDDRALDGLAMLVPLIQSTPEGTPAFAALELEVARTLLALDLYQAGYTWLERIAEQGDSHPHYIESIDWFLLIQREVPGDTASLERLSEYDPLLYPPSQADELRYLVGQHFYNVDDLDRALESLEAVEIASPEQYLRAQFLIGVIRTRKNEGPAAAEAFKNILRYQRDQGGGAVAEDLAKKAQLALARVFYSVGKFDTAARYYDQIDQDDPEWLDSLFEIAWTYYQRGNYDRALGNLHTLNSPYFFEEYYPESFILQSVILLANCDFRESLRVVEQFTEIYRPLKDELELQLKLTSDPTQFYAYLAKLSKQDEQAELSKRLKRVFNAALRDKKLRRLLRYVLQVDAEKNRLETLSTQASSEGLRSFLQGLLADLTSYRGLVIGEAGQAAKQRIDRVYKELTDLLSQALRVKYETLRAERKLLAAMKRMTAEQVEAAQVKPEAPPADEEHQYWPFEGEYWRDELGAYTFLVVNKCLAKTDGEAPAPAQPEETPAEPPSGDAE
jgi:tetratricopeptide (TPR) repeat protein